MKLTTTLLALAAMSYSASAASLAINFMRSGGVTPAANDGSEFGLSAWNDVDANIGSPATIDGVTFAWNATGTWSGGSANNVENGYIDDASDMTITGIATWLAANGDNQYTVQIINATDTNNGFQGAELRDTNASGTVLGTLSNANLDAGASDTSGQLTASTLFIDHTAGGAGTRSGVAGIIITSSTVPEPSSTALLGLGGLALILRRRK